MRQDDSLDLTLTNDLPVPVLLDWRSCDGTPAIEPLLVQRPLQPGQTSTLRLTLTQAGTVLYDARLLGDGLLRPLPASGLAVLERKPPMVDADRLVTITDWRVRSDGSVVAPGVDPGDALAVFTANGATALDIAIRAHSRLRFRFINACHRSPIALKIDDHDLRFMAIDGLPASPFSARDGQLVLAPGTRIDAFVDATGRPGTRSAIWLHDRVSARRLGQLVYDVAEPLRPAPLGPPDALMVSAVPERLALSSARRIELAVDVRTEGATATWSSPSAFTTATPPAFQVKRGATVVLALLNRAAAPVTFHLHGHRMRWLDRLDDGWKPFWLDTLLVPGGQTVRVAFLAEHVGPWLMEMMGTEWTAPRLVNWYAVS
ncbi:MAG: multicopper oxidase domain-containing protein [Xanthobacteraceae bacterium]|nr:multicopper oxidase domain-containing protein [Xanthobacteraceae bacterium]